MQNNLKGNNCAFYQRVIIWNAGNLHESLYISDDAANI